MNRPVSLILTALLTAPALFAGGMGVLKPGAQRAPLSGVRGELPRLESALKAQARPDFYGVVLAADNAPGEAPSLQTFRAGYSPVPEKVMTLDYMSGCAGTNVAGDFCYMTYSSNSAGSITSVDWVRVDLDTRRIVEKKSQDYALGVCMDMTCDRTTGTVYGISAVSDVLLTIDPATGEATPVAETLPFYTLSADAAGQLYGIALDTATGEGVLYTINKLNGNYMRVGSTGVKMLTDDTGTVAYYQTAEFSSANGSLYWVVANAEGATGLYRVDVATGRGSYMAPFPNNEMMVSLFDVETPADPGVPGAVTAASATADAAGALKVALQFTAPAVTASGSALTALSAVSVYRGTSSEAAWSVTSPEPGKTYTWTDAEASAGFNAYRIVSSNDRGESVPVYVSAFCGEDLPGAPGNVSVRTNQAGVPVISWTAPTTGLNGLPVSADRLTYAIIRDFNGTRERVAEGLKATEFADNTLDLSRQAYPYYYVVAASSAGDGMISQAAGCYTGPAYRLPLIETFKDCQLSTFPWILQSLDLGGVWELNYISTFPGSGPYCDGGMLVFIGFRSVEGAQARISTPLLDFSDVRSPELRFHFYYLDMTQEDLRFDDHMIVEASVDGGAFEPVPGGTYYQHDADTRWTEVVLPLPSLAGKKNVAIGFHGISGGGFDLLVDNIRVQEGDGSAIDSVSADTPHSAPRYYNLQGVSVPADRLTPGIYLRVDGSRTTKVAIP